MGRHPPVPVLAKSSPRCTWNPLIEELNQTLTT
jgi:hypothetical protein